MAASFVGTYWGARAESLESCAARVTSLLEALAEQNEMLSHWYKKTAGRKSSLEEIPRVPASIVQALKANRRDIGGNAISELGFSFSAWNGHDKDLSASIGVTCGSHAQRVRNSAVVSFSPTSTPSAALLKQILKAAVLAFDPDEGVVSTAEAIATTPSLPAWKGPAQLRYERSRGYLND